MWIFHGYFPIASLFNEGGWGKFFVKEDCCWGIIRGFDDSLEMLLPWAEVGCWLLGEKFEEGILEIIGSDSIFKEVFQFEVGSE